MTGDDLDARALNLRLAGATDAEIAQTLGVDAATAAEAADRALGAEPGRETEALERARLDRILMGIWPKVKTGDHGAVDQALKIVDRSAGHQEWW